MFGAESCFARRCSCANVSKAKVMNIFHLSLAKGIVISLPCHADSESELVADAEGGGGWILPGEGF